MEQRERTINALRGLVAEGTTLVVIHSSLARLRVSPNRVVWDVVAAIDDLVERGMTVAVPTFTFSFCGSGLYDHLLSKSEVGILGDALLKREGARRTVHPIYSFAVIGDLSDRLCACANTTTFGDDSIFAEFERHDALIVMLGCDWKNATPFHRYEEIANVPYRYFKDFTGIIRHSPEERPIAARMFVRDLFVDAKNNFDPLVETLRARDEVRSAVIGDALVEAASLGAIGQVAREQLARKPWSYVGNRGQAKKRYEAQSHDALRLTLLGSSNLSLLVKHLSERAETMLPERHVEVQSCSYGQMFESILDRSSELMASPDASVTFFVDRLEDLLAQPFVETISAEAIAERVQQYVSLIQRYRRERGGLIVVHRFARLQGPLQHTADDTNENGVAARVEQANLLLSERLSELEECVIFDPLRLAGNCERIIDSRLWLLGRFPYSEEFSRALAEEYVRTTLSYAGLTTRLIVVDLDNTLWGGIVGEDGVENVLIGGDFPGNAFSHFQSALKQLKEQGVALAICSKNDELIAQETMEKHPDMILRSTDFVAKRINWEPKWINLQAIVDELNLSLRNVLFVDDNPIEREQMRRQLDEVKILDLPEDPALYTDALRECQWLSFHHIGKEDRLRVKTYQQRATTMAAKEEFSDLASFISSLNMTVTLQPLTQDNRRRALQLLQKTNQFNTTTRRHDAKALRARQDDGAQVIVVAVEDRFTARENMGLLILCPNPKEPTQLQIETYLLSCRVLGKGVEIAVLDYVRSWARDCGFTRLYGEVIKTERNVPAQRVYQDAGFEHMGEGWWSSSTEAPARVLNIKMKDEALRMQSRSKYEVTP